MKINIEKGKKILNELNKLDAQYLVGYPKEISRSVYLKKRNALKKKFMALKN